MENKNSNDQQINSFDGLQVTKDHDYFSYSGVGGNQEIDTCFSNGREIDTGSPKNSMLDF